MNIAQMNLQDALDAYTAERTTELMVEADTRASTLQKYRAITHRADAEHHARKAGATLDDLKTANEAAYKMLAGQNGDHYKLVFEDGRLMSYKNGQIHGSVPRLSSNNLTLVNHIGDWQKRGAEIQLYEKEPEPEDISDRIISIDVKTVGPFYCKDIAPGNHCEDSPDGTCSACPHGGDMSKDKAGEQK